MRRQYGRHFSSFLHAHPTCFPLRYQDKTSVRSRPEVSCHSFQPCPWSARKEEWWTSARQPGDHLHSPAPVWPGPLRPRDVPAAQAAEGAAEEQVAQQPWVADNPCNRPFNRHEQPATWNPSKELGTAVREREAGCSPNCPPLGSGTADLANCTLLQTDGNALTCQSCYPPRGKKLCCLEDTVGNRQGKVQK